jgi:hypothetical protein
MTLLSPVHSTSARIARGERVDVVMAEEKLRMLITFEPTIAEVRSEDGHELNMNEGEGDLDKIKNIASAKKAAASLFKRSKSKNLAERRPSSAQATINRRTSVAVRKDSIVPRPLGQR